MLKKGQLKIHTEEIIRLYKLEKLDTTKIASIFNCSPEGVQRLLKRNKIPCRSKTCIATKYTLNENYFQYINTAEKAYFLGLLYADGYHNLRKRNVVLNLQAQDVYIIKKLNNAISSNRPLLLLPRAKETHQDQYRLSVINKTFSESLLKKGMTQAKSITLEFPNESQVPKYLINHFIRGYFDGDGCICLSNGRANTPSVAICASLPFAISLMEIVKKIGCNFGLSKPSKIHKLSMMGRKQCVKFCDWIYHNSDGLYLERKYVKYIAAKNAVPITKFTSTETSVLA